MTLEAKKVVKGYRQGTISIEVLKELDLSISSGEIVAILGQSGSGKSTLMALLAGLDRPDKGEIWIDGSSLGEMGEHALTEFRAGRIGIVFQQYHLMSHLTALENVMLPLELLGRKQPRQKALVLLERVGLGDRVTHFPYQLSGGECQRVAIARALVTQPALLLADEPSGSLDAKTGQEVMALFFELMAEKEMTTILVTHNATLANLCHRQFLLSDGQLQSYAALTTG